MRFDVSGSWLAAPNADGGSHLWSMAGPDLQSPIELGGFKEQNGGLAFHPSGRWIAAGTAQHMALWALAHPYPHVLRGHDTRMAHIEFAADGSFFVSAGGHEVRLWDLQKDMLNRSRVVYRSPTVIWGLWVDPQGKFLLMNVPGDPLSDWVQLDLREGTTRYIEGLLHKHVEISPDGQHAVQLIKEEKETTKVRVVDLGDDTVRLLDLEHEYRGWPFKFLPDGRLLVNIIGEEFQELRAYDLSDASYDLPLGEGMGGRFVCSGDGRFVALHQAEGPFTNRDGVVSVERGTWLLSDLHEGTQRVLQGVGDIRWPAAIDPQGEFLAVGDRDGSVRVVLAGDSIPHLMLGHKTPVASVLVDPKRRWVASISRSENEVRFWPIPEGVPFHALPRDELLARLRALTNVRVVPDAGSSSGYRLDIAEFPGWEVLPTW
jgi:WD40 repeat protein